MNKAKVFIEKYKMKAMYFVYFVNYESQQKNYQLIYPGELVKYDSQADITVFIVPYESQADIKIMRKNFPN